MNAEELYFRSYDFLSLWNDITGEKAKEDLILNYIRNVEETAPLTVNDFDSSIPLRLFHSSDNRVFSVLHLSCH